MSTAIAADLITWHRLLAESGEETGYLSKCQPKTLHYRLLHLPARLTQGARRRRLRIPESWVKQIVAAFAKIAAIPAPG